MLLPKQEIKIVDDSEVEYDENSVLICSLVGEDYNTNMVSGNCFQCNAKIHWSLSASPRVKKVCKNCAFDGGTPVKVAVTETTMVEVLEALGLPDTDEVRSFVMKLAQGGMDHNIAEHERKKKG